jgi:hypothetical protein
MSKTKTSTTDRTGKLQLKRETLRTLTPRAMAAAAGGVYVAGSPVSSRATSSIRCRLSGGFTPG